MTIYEIAVDLKEARMLADEGYGYPDRASAEKELHGRNGIDEFYRRKLKIIPVEVIESKAQ